MNGEDREDEETDEVEPRGENDGKGISTTRLPMYKLEGQKT